MKDKRILLKVIERVYSKNPGIQILIDESMIDICREEGVSPQQVFLLFFAVGFIVMGYPNITFLCAKDRSFLLVIKEKIM